ncbi:MAG: tetratricopeptide repeat protein [Candidatus Comchoanobacterales bacterium]
MFRLWFLLLASLALYASGFVWPVMNDVIKISHLFHYEVWINTAVLLGALLFVCECYTVLRSSIIQLFQMPKRWFKQHKNHDMLSKSQEDQLWLSVVLNMPDLSLKSRQKNTQWVEFYHLLNQQAWEQARNMLSDLGLDSEHPWLGEVLDLHIQSLQDAKQPLSQKWFGLWQQYGNTFMLKKALAEVKSIQDVELLMSCSSDIIYMLKKQKAHDVFWQQGHQFLSLCLNKKTYFERIYNAIKDSMPHNKRSYDVLYVKFLKQYESDKMAEQWLDTKMIQDPHPIWIEALCDVGFVDVEGMLAKANQWANDYDWSILLILRAQCYLKLGQYKSAKGVLKRVDSKEQYKWIQDLLWSLIECQKGLSHQDKLDELCKA